MVNLCIGIEVLLGTGRDEIVNRISLRTAAILASRGVGPSAETAKHVRELYAYRTQVVHGVPGPYKQEVIQTADSPIHAVRLGTYILVSLIMAFLEEPGLEPKNVDERFVFGAFDRAWDKPEAEEAPAMSGLD